MRFECGQLLVDLLSFSAERHGNQVILKWKTTLEINSAGFNIYRAIGEGWKNGDYSTVVRITEQSIPSEGSGSDYFYIDSNVESGFTYYYVLEEIGFDGESTPFINFIKKAQ